MIKKIRLPANGKLIAKLDELVKYSEELNEDLPGKEEFKAGRLVRRGIEKTLELIADTITDIALIIISEKNFEKPEDSRDAIRVLEKNKVLSKDLSPKIQDLLSFRNLLVHRYGRIDEELEFNNISENQEDIVLFVKEIEIFLKKDKKWKILFESQRWKKRLWLLQPSLP